MTRPSSVYARCAPFAKRARLTKLCGRNSELALLLERWQSVTTGLQVGMTASALDARGRIVLASQAGHVLVSANDGASFSAVRVEQPVPAAAVAEAASGALVVAGPRGAQPLALP